MKVIVQEIISGQAFRLGALAGEKSCPVQEFLIMLREQKRADFAKTMNLLERVARQGALRNKEKCRYFRAEKAFEFKPSGTVRIMAFWDDEQVIICSHGFVKKGAKTPEKELKRLRDARRLYFEAKSAGSIKWK